MMRYLHQLALVAIPKQGVNVPPLALPYLAASVRQAGISVRVHDFNLDLYHQTIRSKWHVIWPETSTYLFKGPEFENFTREFYDDVLERWADEIVAMRTEWLGLSCFSYRSIPTVRLLVPKIRRRAPALKIILGGGPVTTYGERLLQEGLADFGILSEGEVALVELLKGNVDYPGIIHRGRLRSTPAQAPDLNQFPLPDYRGIDFSRYVPGDIAGTGVLKGEYDPARRQAGLMGSRGCVRRCSFCDVESYWPKYRWRSAENIFEEMKALYDLHGVNEIYFFDSLLNGNLKSLMQLLEILIRHRPRYRFTLRSMVIVREQPKELYRMLEEAGVVQLMLGVESFSERVRREMRKSFSNALLLQNLEEYAKIKIKIIPLLMSGFPSETEADNEEDRRWLRENLRFNRAPIWRIDWGGTTLVLPGAPLFYEKKYDFRMDRNKDWVYTAEGELSTFASRSRRLRETVEYARSLGWRVGTSYSDGEIVVGDHEKGVVNDRPQDLYPGVGWESDPSRGVVGYAPEP